MRSTWKLFVRFLQVAGRSEVKNITLICFQSCVQALDVVVCEVRDTPRNEVGDSAGKDPNVRFIFFFLLFASGSFVISSPFQHKHFSVYLQRHGSRILKRRSLTTRLPTGRHVLWTFQPLGCPHIMSVFDYPIWQHDWLLRKIRLFCITIFLLFFSFPLFISFSCRRRRRRRVVRLYVTVKTCSVPKGHSRANGYHPEG